MPIYEYRCQACGDEFEIIQKISEGPLVRCDKCGGRLEKLLSRTAFLLKGGGWYADGYGGSAPDKKSGAGEASKEKPAAKPSSAGADAGGAKTDKPASSPKQSGGSSPSN
ncbi:MAG: zinc ribbon domain-containing protein [Acidobacteria bacterium]|jgi:putative FmdB family regulatory protein|nr:zinc ribbon domain-containing protein [Acidobacteriota bacterium]